MPCITFEVSMEAVFSLMYSISAPIDLRISNDFATSLMSGRFSIMHLSFVNMQPNMIGNAAFLKPLIVTSPDRGFPPLIINLSIISLIRRDRIVLSVGFDPYLSDFIIHK